MCLLLLCFPIKQHLTNKYEIIGIIDLPKFKETDVCGYPVIGNDNDLLDLVKLTKNAVITVGQLGDGSLRMKLFNNAKKNGVCVSCNYSFYRLCFKIC